MAWPCISRVCCLARFWSQLDKSDLSVPLTIHSYSDIEEPEEEEAAGGPRREAAADGRPRAGGQLPAGPPPSQDSLAIKRSWKRGSHKRGQVAASPPFAAETQYRQDFRAWPLQKRDAFPWASDCRRVGAGTPAPAPAQPGPARSVYVLPAGGREPRSEASGLPGFPQSCPRAPASTTSYRTPASLNALEGPVLGMHQGCVVKKTLVCRTPASFVAEVRRQEYRPWTGAKPSKPIKTKQGFVIPEDHFVQETSYRADFKIPEAQTKFSPNPSAVFQAPSRILNV